MRYRVELSQRAERDIVDAHAYIQRDAPERAARWRQRLLTAIDSLERWPLRYSLAPEAEAVDIEVRQMLFGQYRILYIIEGEAVHVLTVRHGARRPLEPDDMRKHQ